MRCCFSATSARIAPRRRQPLLEIGGDLPTAVLAFGHSRAARLLETMIVQGYVVDGRGRLAFDGAFLASAGAGKGSFNIRFAQPARDPGPDVDLDFAADWFPFTAATESDPATSASGSVLDKLGSGPVPKIIMLNSATDYWAQGASLTHAAVDGSADIPVDRHTRLYFVAGGGRTSRRRRRTRRLRALSRSARLSAADARAASASRWLGDAEKGTAAVDRSHHCRWIAGQTRDVLRRHAADSRRTPAIAGVRTAPPRPRTAIRRRRRRHHRAAKSRQSVHDARAAAGCRRPRQGRHTPAGDRGAARHLHRLEFAERGDRSARAAGARGRQFHSVRAQ